jgi:chemotaxis protein methyltransferase CheR
MTDAQFEYIRGLARNQAGINIPDYKKNMVYRRISKRLGALNIKTFEEYVELLKGADGSGEHQHFINALTTNKTSFFRELHHFEHLANIVLPNIRQSFPKDTKKTLRIWSAGCSIGAEPYSVAIKLADNIPDLDHWDAKILATDIDTEMINQGSIGIYDKDEMENVRPLHKQRHFNQLPGDRWGVSDALRKLVVFNQLNLHGEWPMQRKFDAIFCRNVIIYFDKPSQAILFDRLANLMNDGAYLYIGHSESLFKVTERFASAGQNIHRKIA